MDPATSIAARAAALCQTRLTTRSEFQGDQNSGQRAVSRVRAEMAIVRYFAQVKGVRLWSSR